MGEKLFLSRLILNPRSNEVRRDLGNCQQIHRTILSAFPQVDNNEAKAREQFGVLFRLDADKRHGSLKLLVQSEVEPDWSKLPDGYLLETNDEPNPACKAVDASYKSLSDGMRLRFRLRANPTRRISSSNTNEKNAQWHGKRIEIRGEENQINWLHRKGEGAGFKITSVRINNDVPNLSVSPEARVKFFPSDQSSKQTGERKNRPLTFGSVLFEGELIVTNAEAFRSTISKGIGSGKAYGFGLLSIASA